MYVTYYTQYTTTETEPPEQAAQFEEKCEQENSKISIQVKIKVIGKSQVNLKHSLRW